MENEGQRDNRSVGGSNWEKGVLSEINTVWKMKYICRFEMAVGNLIDLGGKILKHIHIPIKIKRVLVRFGVNWDWKQQVVRTVWGQTTSTLSYPEVITLGEI